MEKHEFNKRIEKRIRKDIRINQFFKKDDKIYVNDKLSKFLIEKIIGTLPKTYTTKEKANKIIIKHTLDDECNNFLNKILFNKKEAKIKGIKLLRTITDKEALLFAKYNNIKFIPNKKNKEIKNILDKLENQYPQTRFSLLKSIESLK
tara:strand:- start:144 stop:587 length:444 start_codon:yes stop_codon:yes gene_type:complete